MYVAKPMAVHYARIRSTKNPIMNPLKCFNRLTYSFVLNIMAWIKGKFCQLLTLILCILCEIKLI